MKYRILKKGDLIISQVGMGLLTMSKLQANFAHIQYAQVIEAALMRGINYFDTAQFYGADDIACEVIRQSPTAILCTKSYSYDLHSAEKATNEFMKAIKRDYIDIMLLHEQESEFTIKGHYEALEYYLSMQRRGLIGQVGISTHYVAGVRGAIQYNLDIVQAMYNYKGLGIVDGTMSDMQQACEDAKVKGIGVIGMKVFGGGHLLGEREKAVQYIVDSNVLDTCAVGMMSVEEVNHTCDMFAGIRSKPPIVADKNVAVMDWCTRCGKCVKKCPTKAIHLGSQCAIIDKSKCILCGYCGGVCSEMALKIF